MSGFFMSSLSSSLLLYLLSILLLLSFDDGTHSRALEVTSEGYSDDATAGAIGRTNQIILNHLQESSSASSTCSKDDTVCLQQGNFDVYIGDDTLSATQSTTSTSTPATPSPSHQTTQNPSLEAFSKLQDMLKGTLEALLEHKLAKYMVAFQLVLIAVAILFYFKMPGVVSAAMENRSVALNDDMTYEGGFKDGACNGFGILRDKANKIIYEGHWKNGRRNGSGTNTFPDGTISTGEWVDDLLNGKATFISHKGQVTYVGEVKNSRRHGFGRLESKIPISEGEDKVTIYEGEWKDGMMSRGKYTDIEGSVFEGSFAMTDNGPQFDGEGTITFFPGYKYVKYVGQFSKGKKHGQGRMDFSDGSYYVGGWEDDLMHGTGVDTYKDGSLYVGQFAKGLKHGKGVFTEPEPSSSNTTTTNTQNSEQSTSSASSSSPTPTSTPTGNTSPPKDEQRYIRFKGTWKNDRPIGKGITTYPDGTSEEKEYKPDDNIDLDQGAEDEE